MPQVSKAHQGHVLENVINISGVNIWLCSEQFKDRQMFVILLFHIANPFPEG